MSAAVFGIVGLDELLPSDALIALSGPAQSGKTWLAAQFLLAGPEPALHVTVSRDARPREALPLAARGQISVKRERLSRPLTTWLAEWLDEHARPARVAIEVAVSLEELSPREAAWLTGAQRELAARGVSALITVRAASADPKNIAQLSQMMPDASATLLLELRSSEWGLERQLLLAGVRGRSVPSRFHALELSEGGVRLASDGAATAEAAAEAPLYLGAPPYLQGAQKRLYVQRVRRQLEAVGAPGVKPIQSKPFFSQVLGELYAPRTDFGAVLVSEPGVVRHLAEKGLLLPLEDVFPDHGALFIEKALKQAAFSGHLYALPQHVSVRVLYYRADLLRKHGLTPPRTWDELESQCDYVLARERDRELGGLTFEYRPSARLGVLLDHVWASGQDLYREQGGAFQLDVPRVVDALSRLRRLVDEKKHARLAPTPSEHWDCFQRFFSGKALFLQHWSDGLRLIHERGKDARRRFGWCPLPSRAPGVAGQALAAGVSYVVPKNTRQPDAARRAVRRLAEPEFLARMEPQFGWPFPASASLYDDPRVIAAHPYYERAHELLARSRLLEEAPYLVGDPFAWTRAAGDALGRAFQSLRPDAEEPATVAEMLDESLGALSPQPAYHGLAARAVELIERELHQPLSGQSLAERLGVSRPHLATTFRRTTGSTVHDFVTERRIARARELLHHSELNVSEVAARLGFKTVQHFSRVFKERTRLSPREFRNTRSG